MLSESLMSTLPLCCEMKPLKIKVSLISSLSLLSFLYSSHILSSPLFLYTASNFPYFNTAGPIRGNVELSRFKDNPSINLDSTIRLVLEWMMQNYCLALGYLDVVPSPRQFTLLMSATSQGNIFIRTVLIY